VEGLTSLPAHRLAQLLRARELSATELLAAQLDRLEAVNPAVIAVVRLAPDAVDRARAADQAVARGEEPGPLHGVPFTAKDNVETGGVVTAIGVPERAGTVPAADATAVARLRAAGGILLGKTNCPPWGGGLETDNLLHGRTINPL
jgi:Asp-tRNA(Asn)/Glu-tRNA(Gln) amidotransferase A subunit family amidase